MGYYAIVARFIHFKHWVQGGRGPTVLTFSQFCLNLLLYPFDQILRAGPRMANDHFFFFPLPFFPFLPLPLAFPPLVAPLGGTMLACGLAALLSAPPPTG